MNTHCMKLFRFSNFASSIHAVADWPGVRAVSSRWRRWLAVGLLAGSDGVSNGLNAVLDEVMLFDRALTDAEVSQVYNATRAP